MIRITFGLFCALVFSMLGVTPAAIASPAQPGAALSRADRRSAAAAPLYTGCTPVTSAPVANAGFEQTLLELVNARRASLSIPPLKKENTLVQSARYYAYDMAQEDYFNLDRASYDRSGATLTKVCEWYERIDLFYGSSNFQIGENIAAGLANPQAVFDEWIADSGSLSNLVDPENWETGIGYALNPGAGESHYWVEDFGHHSSRYPLIINNEDASTASQAVDLYLYGEWSQVRFSYDKTTWSAWQTFTNAMSFTLAGGRGEITLYAQMRNASTTVTSSDSIILDLDLLYLPLVVSQPQ
jgi:uncharacterized protein YkwD